MAQFVVTYFGLTAPVHSYEGLTNRIRGTLGRARVAPTNGGSYIVAAPDVGEADSESVVDRLRAALPEWKVFPSTDYQIAFEDD